MELRQLRYVLELNERRSFTRAAAQLGIAQPALTQSVAALERTLGITLFDRRKRPIVPTVAGLAFIEGARQILNAADALQTNAREHSAILRGRVDIGTMLFLGATALPRLIADFHRGYPAVDLVLHQGMTQDMLGELRAGALDLALINSPASANPDLDFIEVGHEPLAIAAPADHPLGGRRNVALAELRDEPFVTYQSGSGLYATFIAAARVAGFTPRTVVQSRDTSMLRALVAEGMGVSLLPAAFLHTPGPAVSVIELRERMSMELTFALGPGVSTNPAGAAFISFLRERLDVA